MYGHELWLRIKEGRGRVIAFLLSPPNPAGTNLSLLLKLVTSTPEENFAMND